VCSSDLSKQFVEAGINKVGEVWAKQKADFQIAYNAPIKEIELFLIK
jgi:hypothetical protein